MNSKSLEKALQTLEDHNIEIIDESHILYPRGKEFNEDVHASLDLLQDEYDFSIKYI
jgi:hypothetical protein